MPRAVSNYKQVRLTLTEEHGRDKSGRVNLTLRVMVKPLEAEWNMRHTVIVDRRTDMDPLSDMGAVFAALLEFLAAPPLPGHIG